MNRYINNSKIQLTFLLLVLYAITFFRSPGLQNIFPILIAVTVCVISDLLFLRVRKIQIFLPTAAIVTGIIIGLLNAPNLPWYSHVLVSVLAMASKNFIAFPRHIFNPAAFGLFITSLFLNYAVSWWGVSWFYPNFSNLSTLFFFLVLLIPGYIAFVRMKRFRIILSFLTATLALSILQTQSFSFASLLVILDPTILFFALVMLPEPMTTPNNPTRQILFGIITALLVTLPSLLNFPAFSDPLILALLAANLIFYKFRS